MNDIIGTYIVSGIILPIAVGILLFVLLGRPKYELTYDFLSYDLLTHMPGKIDEISIFYRDEKIKNLAIVKLLIKNSGNQPIETKDFDTALAFTFENSKIFNCSVDYTFPSHLQPKLLLNNDKVEIQPLPLNPSDEFVLKIIIHPLDKVKIFPTSRISKIKALKKGETSGNFRAIPVLIMLAGFLIYGLMNLLKVPDFYKGLFGLLTLLLIAIFSIREYKIERKITKTARRRRISINYTYTE